MGTLCPGSTNHTVTPTTPTGTRSAKFKLLSNVRRIVPKATDLFEQKYECENRKLGFGYYGDVKKCVHKDTGIVRAVKIFSRDRIGSKNINESQFLRQINVLNQISHPCFIRVHEYFEERDYFYLVMDYHRDGDLLRKLVDQKKLAEDYVKKVIRKILIGVAYLHKLNIAHRDLKPENILVTDKGDDLDVKIIDFDTSDNSDEYGLLSGLFGTPYYMAPEMLNPKYGVLCDIWSVGIILYNLLTGSMPFPKLSDHQFIDNLKKLDINLNSHELVHVSESCKKLLKAMLTKNPLKRITAEEALMDPWFSQPNLDSICSILTNIEINKVRVPEIKDYLVSNFSILEDFEDLDRAFVELDKDYDGMVCVMDFQELFSKTCSKSESELKTSALLDCFQGCGQDYITYEEFLKSTINLRGILDENRISRFLGKIFIKQIGESEEGIEEDYLMDLKEKIENNMTTQEFRALMMDKLFSLNY